MIHEQKLKTELLRLNEYLQKLYDELRKTRIEIADTQVRIRDLIWKLEIEKGKGK